jgi:hypothetical protein
MPPALIAPYTAPTKTLLHNLLPWLEPALLLEPAQAGFPGCPAELLDAGAVRLLPSLKKAAPGHDEANAELTAMLRQWEDWIASQRSAGRLDSIKAGVAPAMPKRETVRSLMDEIRSPEPQDQNGVVPPGQPPELILHLSHIRGLLAQDVEGIYAQVDQGQSKLRQSLGIDPDEDDALEMAEAIPDGQPPIDYRLKEEGDMRPRAAAWAELLPISQAEGAVLATEGGELAGILGERLKVAGQKSRPDRSKAGAEKFEPYFISWPPKAAGMTLPDLSSLSASELLELLRALQADGAFEQLRSGFAEILDQAAGQALDPELASRLQSGFESLTRIALKHLPQTPRQVRVDLILLPGLDLPGAIELMKGHAVRVKPEASLPLLTLELV